MTMTRSWRELLPVHPAAELFPRVTRVQIKELADDIERNGLRQRVDLIEYRDGRCAVLDGINRLDALELLGETILDHKGKLRRDIFHKPVPLDDRQAVPWVISANIRRRHLNAEQTRELITKLLKLEPKQSDRQVAKQVGVDHKTVATVRSEAEARGEIPHGDTRKDSMGREQPAKKKVKPRQPCNIEGWRLVHAWERVSPGGRAFFMDKVGPVYADKPKPIALELAEEAMGELEGRP